MTVYYNSANNLGRIRFSLMHELGHYMLGHSGTSQENEDEADCFASYILAPRVAINYYQCSTADQLHDRFGLSYAAANRTLIDYNTWNKSEPSRSDTDLDFWIFNKEWFLRREAALLRLRKKRRSTKKQLKYQEERSQFIRDNFPEYEDQQLEYQRLGHF